MQNTFDTLTEAAVKDACNGEMIGREIIFLQTTTSTNDIALDIARQRENPEGIVVIADSQSRGRGRLGRHWISPPGANLYFSVILRPPFSPEECSIFTLADAVAVTSAIRAFTGLNATIKWPNDILVNKRKAGGMLMEMKSSGNAIRALVIGVGLNVNMSPGELPEDIRLASTSLKAECGHPVERAALLGKILEEMEHRYKILLKGNKGALINEWIRLNSTIGSKVTVRTNSDTVTGMAKDINERGELIIECPSGTYETVRAGDVTILTNR